MLFFKHAELAAQYHVSLKTVHNWIDEARQDKINLELYLHNGRTYVADNPSNIAVLDRMITERKKFRNNKYLKTITPSADFYRLFTKRQILDIITTLDVHREIPRQYNYVGSGAEFWDEYAKQQAQQEEGSNFLKGTLKLIHDNMSILDVLVQGYEKVNVIDIGPGNGIPSREPLEWLLSKNMLNRYIAIDISQKMLDIAQEHLEEWFGDRLPFEGHVRDVTYERFDDLLVDDMLTPAASKTLNLVLLLGSPTINLRAPNDLLQVVCRSMGYRDLLVYNCVIDAEVVRRNFNANNHQATQALSPKYGYIFDLLNVDNSYYDVENGYDEKKAMRYLQVRLKVDLAISFEFDGVKRVSRLDKGDTILLWRAWHKTALGLAHDLGDVGFEMRHASIAKEHGAFLGVFELLQD